ncbi:hypothetical protein BKA70DRAFT_1223072 [Coprinopsis sp. MPI-PUGE-AT-0042]|nr:hypothetical protein BKA70DRAFT_1223072 [Coprinopsis sp. MPI-PUGE-AT-0042]
MSNFRHDGEFRSFVQTHWRGGQIVSVNAILFSPRPSNCDTVMMQRWLEGRSSGWVFWKGSAHGAVKTFSDRPEEQFPMSHIPAKFSETYAVYPLPPLIAKVYESGSSAWLRISRYKLWLPKTGRLVQTAAPVIEFAGDLVTSLDHWVIVYTRVVTKGGRLLRASRSQRSAGRHKDLLQHLSERVGCEVLVHQGRSENPNRLLHCPHLLYVILGQVLWYNQVLNIVIPPPPKVHLQTHRCTRRMGDSSKGASQFIDPDFIDEEQQTTLRSQRLVYRQERPFVPVFEHLNLVDERHDKDDDKDDLRNHGRMVHWSTPNWRSSAALSDNGGRHWPNPNPRLKFRSLQNLSLARSLIHEQLDMRSRQSKAPLDASSTVQPPEEVASDMTSLSRSLSAPELDDAANDFWYGTPFLERHWTCGDTPFTVNPFHLPFLAIRSLRESISHQPRLGGSNAIDPFFFATIIVADVDRAILSLSLVFIFVVWPPQEIKQMAANITNTMVKFDNDIPPSEASCPSCSLTSSCQGECGKDVQY